jgi:hypothetical protein
MRPGAGVGAATYHLGRTAELVRLWGTRRILLTMTRRKVLRVVDIAEILGVSKQRADQLRREPDFPAPVDRWARGICGRLQTFDGGRGPTPAARPGGV